MDERWQDDEQLLAALGEALHAADEMPRSIVALGEAAFDWRTLDADLATLTYDSAVDPLPEPDDEPALVRADAAPVRALRFQAQVAAIVLEVTEEALVGQIVPPLAAEISLLSSLGRGIDTHADELGYFAFRPVPRGSFRLRCRTSTGSELITSWFQL